jgi:hypothetical protein
MDVDKAFDAAGLFPEAAKLYKLHGDSYAIPYDRSPVTLAYNNDTVIAS